MNYMFNNAASFNQPLATWVVSSVTTMNYMFAGAESFNQPLANWDVSSVTSMAYMFYFASSFNHQLGNWNVLSNTNVVDIFTLSGCPAVGDSFTLSCFNGTDYDEWEVVYDCSDPLSNCTTVRHFESRTRKAHVCTKVPISLFDYQTFFSSI
jgi:surface protein